MIASRSSASSGFRRFGPRKVKETDLGGLAALVMEWAAEKQGGQPRGFKVSSDQSHGLMTHRSGRHKDREINLVIVQGIAQCWCKQISTLRAE